MYLDREALVGRHRTSKVAKTRHGYQSEQSDICRVNSGSVNRGRVQTRPCGGQIKQ